MCLCVSVCACVSACFCLFAYVFFRFDTKIELTSYRCNNTDEWASIKIANEIEFISVGLFCLLSQAQQWALVALDSACAVWNESSGKFSWRWIIACSQRRACIGFADTPRANAHRSGRCIEAKKHAQPAPLLIGRTHLACRRGHVNDCHKSVHLSALDELIVSLAPSISY